MRRVRDPARATSLWVCHPACPGACGGQSNRARLSSALSVRNVRGRLAAGLAAAALALTGCGGDGKGQPARATVALDFTPNAVHAPIYAAVRNGYDRRHGVRIRTRPPGSAP